MDTAAAVVRGAPDLAVQVRLRREDFTSQTALANFVKYCARATAYAHARADKDYDTAYVGYNFENGALDAIAAWPNAKTTMADLGETYSDQVLADYGQFLELRADGEL